MSSCGRKHARLSASLLLATAMPARCGQICPEIAVWWLLRQISANSLSLDLSDRYAASVVCCDAGKSVWSCNCGFGLLRSSLTQTVLNVTEMQLEFSERVSLCRAKKDAADQDNKNRLKHLAELGRLLSEAKQQVGHGQWMPLLNDIGVQQQRAWEYMALDDWWDEISKSPALGDFSIRKALEYAATGFIGRYKIDHPEKWQELRDRFEELKLAPIELPSGVEPSDWIIRANERLAQLREDRNKPPIKFVDAPDLPNFLSFYGVSIPRELADDFDREMDALKERGFGPSSSEVVVSTILTARVE